MTYRGELFLEQVREAQHLDMGILTMPSYEDPYMTHETATMVGWPEFRDAMHPLAVVHFGDSATELAVTPKTVAWGVEDVNIFAGNSTRAIDEISDLTQNEGRDFFGINFLLARQLIKRRQAGSAQISIGFNPQDFSVGHHSIPRLHSHVRVTSNPMDLTRRQRYGWRELDRFDRMGFIEPFSYLHHDFIANEIEAGLFADQLMAAPERRLGYTALHLHSEQKVGRLFADVQALYASMKDEYTRIAGIFTDGAKDKQLDRYLPRPPKERQERLAAFLKDRGAVYSEHSKRALTYLAHFILPARPRGSQNPRDMSSANTMYITRGFAGAINFDFSAGHQGVRMDFLPRVVTTTGITKTIMGEHLPTIIAKTKSPASPTERRVTARFHRRVRRIMRQTLPYWLVEYPKGAPHAA